jgi:uncharacterized cupin superfamily protein
MSQPVKSALLAIDAKSVPPRTKPSNYPEPFFSRMSKREKRPLGDHFGLKNFGVNLTRLFPGGESALLHRHSKQDEFVYILQGQPTLVTDGGETVLGPGMCAGFAAAGRAHHLVNRTELDVLYLEIGDRSAGDEGFYPTDDLRAVLGPDGKWIFTHKDGTLY